MKVFNLEGGIKVATFAPSPDFNPLTASADELAANGFPAMPEHPRHRERYASVWNRIKNKFHYIEPTFRVDRNRRHGPRKPGLSAGPETSGNWSGGVVFAPAGQTFKYVLGEWVVPAVSAPVQGQWCDAAIWIGIDGDGGSPDVVQAGVTCSIYQSPGPQGSITTAVVPWWEWAPASLVAITNVPVSPGDMLSIVVCATTNAEGSSAGATTGLIQFVNYTTGAYTNIQPFAPPNTALVGNCAEWIVEGYEAEGTPLPYYGEVFFSGCEAYTVGGAEGTIIYANTGDSVNMDSPSGTVISEGNLISPNIVQCVYTG